MGSSTMIYKLVSSAKSLIEELMPTTMSLIYKKNRRGPRIEPCGNPALTEVQEENNPILCFVVTCLERADLLTLVCGVLL